MTGKEMVCLKWKLEISQAQQLWLNVEKRLFRISSAATLTVLTLSMKSYYFPI